MASNSNSEFKRIVTQILRNPGSSKQNNTENGAAGAPIPVVERERSQGKRNKKILPRHDKTDNGQLSNEANGHQEDAGDTGPPEDVSGSQNHINENGNGIEGDSGDSGNNVDHHPKPQVYFNGPPPTPLPDIHVAGTPIVWNPNFPIVNRFPPPPLIPYYQHQPQQRERQGEYRSQLQQGEPFPVRHVAVQNFPPPPGNFYPLQFQPYYKLNVGSTGQNGAQTYVPIQVPFYQAPPPTPIFYNATPTQNQPLPPPPPRSGNTQFVGGPSVRLNTEPPMPLQHGQMFVPNKNRISSPPTSINHHEYSSQVTPNPPEVSASTKRSNSQTGSMVLCYIPDGVNLANAISPGVHMEVLGSGYFTSSSVKINRNENATAMISSGSLQSGSQLNTNPPMPAGQFNGFRRFLNPDAQCFYPSNPSDFVEYSEDWIQDGSYYYSRDEEQIPVYPHGYHFMDAA